MVLASGNARASRQYHQALNADKPTRRHVPTNARAKEPIRRARFAFTGLPVVADEIPDFAGPLAGVLAGLDWAAAHAPETEWIASVPGDCPFLPRDLVARLHAVRLAENKPLACARSGEWRHPVVGLWQVALRDDLRHALTHDLGHFERAAA